MANKSTIYIVCSDRHRNGKTLLARLLVEYLLLEGHDPFVLDTEPPQGPLRSSFPGRTALVDFSSVTGQMKLFDTIINGPGRDYVIDLATPQFEGFFDIQKKLDFAAEATRVGFRIVVLFIVDKYHGSLAAADDVRHTIYPGFVILVNNAHVAGALSWGDKAPKFNIPAMDRDVSELLENKRFSVRNFLLGDEYHLEPKVDAKLRSFLTSAVVRTRQDGTGNRGCAEQALKGSAPCMLPGNPGLFTSPSSLPQDLCLARCG